MIDMTGKILVVVDMQPGYRKAMTPGVVDAVDELVKAAVRAESLVVFLEFCDAPTLKRLLNRCRRYDQFVIEQKQQCDGSDQVLAACERGRYDMDAFVVCGVETHACVRDTARELAHKVPDGKVEVVAEACGSETGNDWSAFPSAANLDVVYLSGHRMQRTLSRGSIRSARKPLPAMRECA